MWDSGTSEGSPSPALSSPDAATRLRHPRHRVERRAILWWTLRVVVSAFVVLGGLAVTYLLWDDGRIWIGPVFAVSALAHVFTAIAMPVWRYHVHRWERTELSVYELKGWLVREWRIVPVSRIQNVDMVRGPLQQMLNLGTLRVITASPEGQIKIGGLDAETVAWEAAALTELTQQSSGDAT